ncbi:MAG: hypothetical protein WA908_03445 [Pontixanthobacter sp.]
MISAPPLFGWDRIPLDLIVDVLREIADAFLYIFVPPVEITLAFFVQQQGGQQPRRQNAQDDGGAHQ